MPTAHLFSTSQGELVDDWPKVSTNLSPGNVLWMDEGDERPRFRQTGETA